MKDGSYYECIPEDGRRDLAFSIVAIIREAVNIAQENKLPATYEQALVPLYDLDPNLYTFCIQELQVRMRKIMPGYSKIKPLQKL
jgi:hypothetical protein